ncbi:MAG: hypothetical protein V3V05_10925 [Pontiella sp.]
MTQQFELFGVDLEDPIEPPKVVVAARKMDRSKSLLGRCTRCGAHIAEEPGLCQECLGSQVCNCHVCLQVASLHRALQDDLYWARRDNDAEQQYRVYLAMKAEGVRKSAYCKEVSS